MGCMSGLLLEIQSSEGFFFSFLCRLSRMVSMVKGIGKKMTLTIVQYVSKTFFASMRWSPTWRRIQITH